MERRTGPCRRVSASVAGRGWGVRFRTLGFMNEMAAYLRYQVAEAGCLSHCDISALNHGLRRSLHNRGGYLYPILVAQRLAARA